MKKRIFKQGNRMFLVVLLALVVGLFGCEGDDGAAGAPGAPGSSLIDASSTPASLLGELEVTSEITSVSIASPPVVKFKVETADGVAISGIGTLRESDSRYVRFTITKLVPGANGDPDTWVAYTRDTAGDGSTPPDYDSGSSLVDHGDGTYTFTFNTDVKAVTGVTYESGLTHRVAGQIGSSSVALQPQNLVYDFVPATGASTVGKKVAMEASCNECHDNLVIHGRRFKIDYCVNCHNPDLAINLDGVSEGNLSYMTHKIHSAGTFTEINDRSGTFQAHVTHIGYPASLADCRKCHSGADTATPDGDNWKNVPSQASCGGCHGDASAGTHPFDMADNSGCAGCHDAAYIEDKHATPNATENNPNLVTGMFDIDYVLDSATVDGSNNLTIVFEILADGVGLDVTNLPADLLGSFRGGISYPSFLLAWAESQNGVMPAEFNNLGNSAAQPTSIGLDDLAPIDPASTIGTLSCSAGVCTAVINAGSGFPAAGATMRTVGLQGYFTQDLTLNGSADESLHTQSAILTVDGDTSRRSVADSAGCASCHEIFEGHGGNRVFTADGGVQICTMCHVPNLSSGGRTDNLLFPEDTNNFKDLVHGIHGAAKRELPMEFVRIRSGARLYAFLTAGTVDAYLLPAGTVIGDYVEINDHAVTYPTSSSNCTNCHLSGTNELPVPATALPTTVRTTDGTDATPAAVATARGIVPNTTDWVNSPTASACVYCHDSDVAAIHMMQNGGELSSPVPGVGFVTRGAYDPAETCVLCHGPGRSADVETVHGL